MVIQNDADTTSVHSGNDSWRWKRPLDVVMTTQPSFRRRLAEARGSVMRSGRCRRETSPSRWAIESLHVGDVGLERGSRARVGPMHCDHLVPSALPAEEAHPGRTGIFRTF